MIAARCWTAVDQRLVGRWVGPTPFSSREDIAYIFHPDGTYECIDEHGRHSSNDMKRLEWSVAGEELVLRTQSRYFIRSGTAFERVQHFASRLSDLPLRVRHRREA